MVVVGGGWRWWWMAGCAGDGDIGSGRCTVGGTRRVNINSRWWPSWLRTSFWAISRAFRTHLLALHYPARSVLPMMIIDMLSVYSDVPKSRPYMTHPHRMTHPTSRYMLRTPHACLVPIQARVLHHRGQQRALGCRARGVAAHAVRQLRHCC